MRFFAAPSTNTYIILTTFLGFFLNSASSLVTSLNTIGPINCLTQPPAPKSQFFSADMDDCRRAVLPVTFGDKPSAPITWSRDGSRGFQVPHKWRYRTCIILVDCLDSTPGAEDMFSLVQVSLYAREIMEKCVRDYIPRLGGLTPIGRSSDFFVSVAGAPDRGENNATEAKLQLLEPNLTN